MLPSTSKWLSLFLFVLIIFISVAYGQQPNQQESDVIAKAQSLFNEKKYQEALPLFAQLVSVHPENPEYNYKFGVCTFHGDRSDRRRPIRYLSNALKSMGSDPQLHYYLGMAYYQNEEFAEAMKFLNLYLAKLDAGSPERPVILEKVNACLNGLSLEHSNIIEEFVVTAEFQKDNFHRAYRADEFSGMLILKPDNFISPKEKSEGTNSFVYISEPRGTIYFSGYESASTGQLDLFKVKMLENGDWGTPEKISDVINTNFDESYPVLTDYGTTLYFCSKGHNSIGGYDVFRSKLDTASGKFETPENLGKGVNSPFNDILYIPDKTGRFAYFASDRDNLNNGINVYKIRIIENPFGQQEVLLVDNSSSSATGKDVENTEAEDALNTNRSQGPEVIASTKDPELAPSEKAEKLMNKRTMVHQLADTAYILVAQTKDLIRSLTNKRDRANAISTGKSETAKKLEIEFDELIDNLVFVDEDDMFEKQLGKAIEIKKKIFQNRARADYANLIAWNYGKQIKIKDKELEEFKKKAGEVQTLSLSTEYDKTTTVYNELMNQYKVADSLSDYSVYLLKINSDEAVFDVPESELAFAGELRTSYQNNTLFARTGAKANTQVISIDPSELLGKSENKPARKFDDAPIIKLYDQVEAVHFVAGNGILIDEDIQIDLSIDAVEPAQLVDFVTADFINIAYYDEEIAEIDFAIDAIDPYKQIEEIAFSDVQNNTGFDNEDLEISFVVDIVPAAKLIQQVAFNQSVDINIEVAELEIGFGVDAIEPTSLVQQIDASYDPIAFFEDEEIEINNNTDIIEPTALVELVAYTNQVVLPDLENELEIDSGFDAVTPEPVVESIAWTDQVQIEITETPDIQLSNEIVVVSPVEFNPASYAEVVINETPEISENSEDFKLEATDQVESITFDFRVFEVPDESIYISEDIQIAAAIETIAFMDHGFDIPEENLEIVTEETNPENVEWALVQPVTIGENELKMDVAAIDEDLYISRESLEPIPVVQPVFPDDLAYKGIEIEEENLEIGLRNNAIKATGIIRLTEPVYQENLTFVPVTIDEEPEIDFAIDAFQPVNLTQQIAFSENPSKLEIGEDEIEISFYIDQIHKAQLAVVDGIMDQTKPVMVESISQMPAIGTELFYLRESMSIANDIETSRTDYELLKIALTDPGQLSYEELLFSASLAPKPEDKLAIYNQAFIHLHRDWRAFNNAAVTAMNMKDFDKAECYLYQASLISEDNGKIQNNMGILACYLKHYNEAETYFIAASNLGVDADYNLSVIKNMTQSHESTPDRLQEEIGEHKYYEVLGEAINPTLKD